MRAAGDDGSVQTTDDGGVFGRFPERYARIYLVVAFFVLPAVVIVLSGGGVQRPPGPVATALLWTVAIHHGVFVVASILLD